MNLRSYRLLLDPTGDEGGNGEPTDPEKEVAAEESGERSTDPVSVYKQLLKDREKENFKYREEIRSLKKRVAPDGAVVLKKEDADELSAYRALGKVDDVKAGLSDRDRFKAESDGFRRAESHKQIADAHGYKVAVLSRLIDQEQLDIAVEKDAKTGKPVAFVKDEADGKGRKTPLPDYLKGHPTLADFLPALSIQPDRPPTGTPPRADPSGHPPHTNDGKKSSLYAGANPFSG